MSDHRKAASPHRKLTATLVGLVGFALYVMGAVALADRLADAPELLRAAYFLLAGLAWVLPIRWLMLWSVGMR